MLFYFCKKLIKSMVLPSLILTFHVQGVHSDARVSMDSTATILTRSNGNQYGEVGDTGNLDIIDAPSTDCDNFTGYAKKNCENRLGGRELTCRYRTDRTNTYDTYVLKIDSETFLPQVKKTTGWGTFDFQSVNSSMQSLFMVAVLPAKQTITELIKAVQNQSRDYDPLRLNDDDSNEDWNGFREKSAFYRLAPNAPFITKKFDYLAWSELGYDFAFKTIKEKPRNSNPRKRAFYGDDKDLTNVAVVDYKDNTIPRITLYAHILYGECHDTCRFEDVSRHWGKRRGSCEMQIL